MHSSLLIADRFLIRARKDNVELTPLQILNLVYLSHGLHLALHNDNLVVDDIGVWENCPVIEPLFESIKQYGSKTIPADVQLSSPVPMSDEVMQVIENVYNKFANKTGAELIRFTTRQGSPWQTARYSGNSTLYKDDIRKYFLEDLPQFGVRS